MLARAVSAASAAAAAAAAVPSVSCTLRSRLRVLHASDIHFLLPPSVGQVLAAPKRLVGVTNLFLLRRAAKFSLGQQQTLVAAILRAQPDVLLLSGDITTLALEEEFALAREVLHPLLDNGGLFPTFIIPGNHDAYTHASVEGGGPRGPVAASLMRKYFGPWMERTSEEDIDTVVRHSCSDDKARWRKQIQKQQRHFLQFPVDAAPALAASLPSSSASSGSFAPLPFLPVFAYDFLRLTGLNPCVPRWLGSQGQYDERQLAQLASFLANPPEQALGNSNSWFSSHPHALAARLALAERNMRRVQKDSDGLALPDAPLPPPADSLLPLSSAYHMLTGHYPVLDGAGGPYELAHRWHGVTNGAALRAVLQSPTARLKPHMFLHGHVHRGYQDQLALDSEARHQMLICDPGSSGQTYSEKSKRCAAFNIYTIGRGGTPDAPSAAGSQPAAAASATPARVFPFPQPPPPFAASSPPPPAPRSRAPTQAGARGGVQSVHQSSADGKERYLTSIERWLHNGEEFKAEQWPYSSGF